MTTTQNSKAGPHVEFCLSAPTATARAIGLRTTRFDVMFHGEL